MKQANETHWLKAGWRRFVALALVASMLLIPVQFPNEAAAAENGEVSVPNMFTDGFSDDRHTDGLTYQWNNQGGTNTYYSVGNGYFTFGMPYSEAEGGAYNTISILSAQGKDSATGSSKDYAGEWTNYTAQMSFSKAPVGTEVTYSDGTVKATSALSTVKLLTRVSMTENGYEYYYLQITGGDGDSTGTLSLQRYYYDDGQGKMVSEILKNFGAKTMTAGTWHTMKVKLDGNDITVWYDGEELGTVTDSSDYAIACGSVGLSSQGRGGLQYIDDVLVTFPDDQTAFYDSFTDDRFQQGVTYGWNSGAEVKYQWNELLSGSTTAEIKTTDDNSTYYVDAQTNKNYFYLTAEATDPTNPSVKTDVSAQWTNYSVEMEYVRHMWDGGNNKESSAAPWLLFRMNIVEGDYGVGFTAYAVKLHSGNLYLFEVDYNISKQNTWTNTAVATAYSVSGPSPVDTWRHIKVDVKDNQFTITLTDTAGNIVLKNGEPWVIKDEDNTYKTGTVGVYFDRSSTYNESDIRSAEFDNFKVTMENGAVVFYEDFSAYTAGTDTYKSEGYFAGVLEEYDPNEIQPWDVTYQWTEKFRGSTTSEITKDEAGNYTYLVNALTNRSYFYLTGEATNPGDATEKVGITSSWSDYTLEVDYARHMWYEVTDDTGTVTTSTESSAAPWLLFRMNNVEEGADGTNPGFTAYAIKLHSGRLYLFKVDFNVTASNTFTTASIGSVAAASPRDTWRHIRLEIKGDRFVATLLDENGNQVGDQGSWKDDTYTSGTVGVYLDYTSAASDRRAEFDNFKVTIDDTVVFTEDYTMSEDQTKDTYFAAAKTVEGVYTPETTKDWNVAEGAYAFSGSGYVGINTVSVLNGENDDARNWTDYAVESDFMLSADNAAAGFVARYNGIGSYYQMVLTASGAGLYKVSGSTVTELAAKELAIEKDIWQFAKLTVEGTTLKGYLNGAEILSAELSEDAEGYTAGTAGLLASSAVKYDNFAVYSTEFTESRKYGTYTFKGVETAELSPNWSIGSGWSVADDKLVYTNAEDATAVGVSLLKSKFILGDYYAEASVTTAESGKVGVVGRASLDGQSRYTLTLSLEDGLVLSKTTAGTEDVLHSVSVLELYMQGLQVKKNTGYVLRLYMHGGVIQGYINGQRVIAYTDDAALSSGVTGVVGTNGAAIVSLVTAVAAEPPVLSIVDADGTEITEDNPFTVNPGKVPEIINLYLKVTSGDTSELLPLDTVLEQTGFVESELVTNGTVASVPVTYDGTSVNFCYRYVERADEIAAIDAEITALAAADALTLDNAATVEDLADRYNDLSAEERSGITDENQDKLAAAKEAILVLKYGADVLGEVVFSDTFDSAESESLYTNDYDVTGVRHEGKWFIRNGAMYDYHIEDIGKPTSYFAANALIEKDFQVTSVSVDVQFIEAKAWAGVRFNFRDNEYYEFRVTDKEHRLYLLKNGTATLTDTNTRSTDFRFEVGKWYNLRVTISDSGLIKCYLDDVCWLTYQDEPTVLNDTVLTHGTVALVNCENWAKYDNLEIRGVELDYEPETTVQTNPNLPATSWSDDFQDETAGSDPSHWVDIDPDNKWLVKADGDNLVYGSTGYTAEPSETWLHVFETNVEYTANLRATALGEYPIMGLTARVNAAKSYIRAGYDFTIDKWFIKVRLGADFEEVVTYSDSSVTLTADANTWYTLKLTAEEEQLELYVDGQLVVSADAGDKVMTGRVGVFAEQCDVDIDDVDLQLLSGQGRVNDGVLEYYPTEVGAGSSMYSHFELSDGSIVLHSDGNQYISYNDGVTWEKTTLLSANGFGGGTVIKLRNGKYLNVKGVAGKYAVKLSEDGYTWTSVGEIDYDETTETYAQPGEHLSEVILDDGTSRIFYTIGNQTKGQTDGVIERSVISDVFYSDDYGATWTKAANSPMYTTNLKYFCETHILKITKDVVDATGNTIPAGTLIHYSTYNSSDSMRYSLSYDDGVTWVGDYAMPNIPCGLHSMTIEEDPYNPGTYYMATVYNPPRAIQYGFPRHRMALLRSTDGFTWEYMCDVDRWGDISGPSLGDLMQNVNMYLSVSDEYVWVSFGRADQYSDTGSHNLVIGRLYRFEKTKLEAYKTWPQEYIIPGKSIVAIEADPAETEYVIGSEFDTTGSKIKVYYYDGTSEEVDMADAFIVEPDLTATGKKSVTVDYKHFRTVYTVDVVEEATSEPVEVTVSNNTGSTTPATITAPADGWVLGAKNTFTVSHDKACVVLAKDAEGNYIRLTATASGDAYSFDVTLTEGMEIVVAVAGDVSGDGAADSADAMLISRSCLSETHPAYQALSTLANVLCDLNGDGEADSADVMLISRSCLSETHPAYMTISWNVN